MIISAFGGVAGLLALPFVAAAAQENSGAGTNATKSGDGMNGQEIFNA